MKKLLFIIFIILQIEDLSGQQDFSFVFLPDTHLQPDSMIEAKFKMVARVIKDHNPDFVIAGGDMIYTARNLDEKQSETLFDFMDDKLRELEVPIHYVVGNHECVGIRAESGMAISNPYFGKQMFELRYGSRFKSFTNSGWKFFLLDGIEILEKERNYTTGVDSLQIEWIKNELHGINRHTPIVIVIHSPLINPLAVKSSGEKLLSENAETVLNLFKEYNLRVVLQGHNHVYMNLFFEGVYYISGGSTLYREIQDPYNDGFIYIKISDNLEKIRFVHTDLEN